MNCKTKTFNNLFDLVTEAAAICPFVTSLKQHFSVDRSMNWDDMCYAFVGTALNDGKFDSDASEYRIEIRDAKNLLVIRITNENDRYYNATVTHMLPTAVIDSLLGDIQGWQSATVDASTWL